MKAEPQIMVASSRLAIPLNLFCIMNHLPYSTIFRGFLQAGGIAFSFVCAIIGKNHLGG
jgi:hypothetical protein